MLLNQAIKSFSKHMELIERSKETIRGYDLELNSFSNFVTVKHNCPVYVEDIGLQDIEDYLLYEKERGIASSSRSRSLYILKSFYNYGCKKDICSKNLASLLEPVIGREQIMSDKQPVYDVKAKRILERLKFKTREVVAEELKYKSWRSLDAYMRRKTSSTTTEKVNTSLLTEGSRN